MPILLIIIGSLIIGILLLNFGFKNFKEENSRGMRASAKTIILVIMGVAFIGLFFYYLLPTS